MTRRRLLIGTAVGRSGASIARGWGAPARGEAFVVTHTHPQRLTPHQFAVLCTSATERSFTGALLNAKRRGHFAGAGCAKLESPTGRPSLWAPLEGAIGTTTA